METLSSDIGQETLSAVLHDRGLDPECMYWADGQEYDIEERACRASDARRCEFKIAIGG